MLAARFRRITFHLTLAIHALIGRPACAAVAAIATLVEARKRQLGRLMDRFEAGALLTRAGQARTGGRGTATVRPWPAGGNWLHLVGYNNPDIGLRMRWMQQHGSRPAEKTHLIEFARQMRLLIEQDAEMRGLLAASVSARRLARWFLQMGDADALPAILKEVRVRRTAVRPRPPRPGTRPQGERGRAAPVPFTTPPENLMREEREARGLWVPPAIQFYDLTGVGYTPDAFQRRRTLLGP